MRRKPLQQVPRVFDRRNIATMFRLCSTSFPPLGRNRAITEWSNMKTPKARKACVCGSLHQLAFAHGTPAPLQVLSAYRCGRRGLSSRLGTVEGKAQALGGTHPGLRRAVLHSAQTPSARDAQQARASMSRAPCGERLTSPSSSSRTPRS